MKTLMVSKLQSFVSCKYHLHTVLQQVVLVVVYLLRQRYRYLYISSAQTDIYIYTVGYTCLTLTTSAIVFVQLLEWIHTA